MSLNEHLETKRLNELTFSLYKFYKARIKYIIQYDPDFLAESERYCNLFLDKIHNSNSRMAKAIENKKPIEISSNFPDISFRYKIGNTGRSTFQIKVARCILQEYDADFLENKFRVVNGFVYFLESVHGFKIGYSSKLKRRLREFSVQLPFKFEIHSTIKCPDYKKLETQLHELLSHKRINGEWFNINESDFEEIDIFVKNLGYIRKPFISKEEAGNV